MGNVNHGSSDVWSVRLATHARPRWHRARSWAAALLAAGFVACSSPPSATAGGGSEASALVSPAIAMEEFETSFSGGSCAVKWRGAPALAVEQCKTALAPQSVPIVVAGITYAVWATASCSAAGACSGMQFYAITTHGTSAWASPAFGQGYRLAHIIARPDGITLHLESATKGAAPADFDLRMGEVRNEVPNTAPTPPVAAVLPPSEEEPKIVQRSSDCAITWQGRVLMEDDRCSEGSIAPLSRVEGAESKSPIRAGGANFYIYSILSCGGGTACDGEDFYVVAVTATDAWISDSLGGRAEFGDVTVKEGGISLTLSTPTGTTTCEVKPNSAKCSEPPPEREVKVLSTQTKTITGVLTGGSHADNWLYSIKPSNGGRAILIDNEGKCAVNDGFEPTVEIRLSCETRDDGSMNCTCEQLRVLD